MEGFVSEEEKFVRDDGLDGQMMGDALSGLGRSENPSS